MESSGHLRCRRYLILLSSEVNRLSTITKICVLRYVCMLTTERLGPYIVVLRTLFYLREAVGAQISYEYKSSIIDWFS